MKGELPYKVINIEDYHIDIFEAWADINGVGINVCDRLGKLIATLDLTTRQARDFAEQLNIMASMWEEKEAGCQEYFNQLED